MREPMDAIERIAEGMREVLAGAARDKRIGRGLWASLREQWVIGVAHAARASR